MAKRIRKIDRIIEFLQLITGIGLKKGKKAAPRFELGIKDLQSSALPLGHAAEVRDNSTLGNSISLQNRDVLVLSNGHGEDLIALRILEALHKLQPELNLAVLPLVGEGKTFKKAIDAKWLKKIGPSLSLPSGGFSNQSFRGFLADISVGLFSFLFKHWAYARNSAQQGAVILAVGDLLPLFFAWTSGGVYGFVGTPKSDYTWTTDLGSSLSDYYHLFKGSEWDPWECFFMRSQRCKFVAVRDNLTARRLKKKAIRAYSPGNPMMDGFDQKKCPDELKEYRRLLLLCGSRMPEALVNLRRLLIASLNIHKKHRLMILIATGPEPVLNDIELCLGNLGFSPSTSSEHILNADACWELGLVKVYVGIGKFSKWATFAEVGLCNAGTATEQLVGLGVPCVSLPGEGPQFKKSFAIRQSRLLGGAVSPCLNSHDLAKRVELMLDSEYLRKKLSFPGVKRMGTAGGSAALASFVLKFLIDVK